MIEKLIKLMNIMNCVVKNKFGRNFFFWKWWLNIKNLGNRVSKTLSTVIYAICIKEGFCEPLQNRHMDGFHVIKILPKKPYPHPLLCLIWRSSLYVCLSHLEFPKHVELNILLVTKLISPSHFTHGTLKCFLTIMKF